MTGTVTGTVTGTMATTATAAVTATAATTGATAGTAGGTPVATLVAASAPSATSATLEDLLRKAGYLSRNPPQTLSDIERRGVFDEEPYASMANGIIEGWYSGLVQTPGGTSQTVAWLPALGWKALGYTMAPAYCEGETGIWGSAPAQTARHRTQPPRRPEMQRHFRATLGTIASTPFTDKGIPHHGRVF